MPIAKETLRIGSTIIANEGTYVAQNVVDENDWKDKVDADPKKRSQHRAPKDTPAQ